MKEVMAMIRMNMVGKTKIALSDAGISSFMAVSCMGRGKGFVDFKSLEGAREGYAEAIAQLSSGQRLIPKRLLSIVVPDALVAKVVDTIAITNRTGKPGDGKVFVLPISNAIRIRTSEEGDIVLD